MSMGSLLLRLLLCLSLLVNGVASAAAMPRMEAAVPAAQAMAASGSSASGTHCHQDGPMAMPHEGAKMLAHMHGKAQGHPMPDCCKSGACDCACTQLAQVFSVTPLIVSLVPQATVLPPPEPQRAAPALPHLIRPPIG